jgi:Fe-S cluster assembly ATP-binding protein
MSAYATAGANALATASSSSSSSIARNIQRQTMMASTSSSSSSSSSSANYSSRNRVMTSVLFRRRSSSSSSSLQRSSGKTTIVRAKKGDVILEVSGLKAKVAETGEEILKGVDLIVREGETHAIMGKNGSGKSTLTKVLVGHPAYEVTGGTAKYKGEDLFEMEPEERARAGLFLSFQSPVEVPGVSNTDFLRMMCNERRKHRGEEEMDPLEFYGYLSPKLDKLNMDPSFMTRNVNEGFSGGEKKRNEILQLAVLESEMSILDEIDSGLDVDALRDVSEAVNGLKSDEKGLLLITHYQRLLDLIHPDVVHIMKKGKIVKTGDKSLASTIDEGGFAALG